MTGGSEQARHCSYDSSAYNGVALDYFRLATNSIIFCDSEEPFNQSLALNQIQLLLVIFLFISIDSNRIKSGLNGIM